MRALLVLTYAYMYIHAPMYDYMYVHTPTYTPTCTYVCPRTRTYICPHMLTCAHMYLRTPTYAYICLHMQQVLKHITGSTFYPKVLKHMPVCICPDMPRITQRPSNKNELQNFDATSCKIIFAPTARQPQRATTVSCPSTRTLAVAFSNCSKPSASTSRGQLASHERPNTTSR